MELSVWWSADPAGLTRSCFYNPKPAGMLSTISARLQLLLLPDAMFLEQEAVLLKWRARHPRAIVVRVPLSSLDVQLVVKARGEAKIGPCNR